MGIAILKSFPEDSISAGHVLRKGLKLDWAGDHNELVFHAFEAGNPNLLDEDFPALFAIAGIDLADPVYPENNIMLAPGLQALIVLHIRAGEFYHNAGSDRIDTLALCARVIHYFFFGLDSTFNGTGSGALTGSGAAFSMTVAVAA